MLDVLIQFVRLSSFKEMPIEEIVDFFDTELIESIRYLYSDHRLNYDKLYQQEKLHSIDKLGSKGTNYEQYAIQKLKELYHWDDILKYAIENNKVTLGNYNKIFQLSNKLKSTDKKLNKLEKIFIREKFKDTNIDVQLILDSYKNYYSGSIYDLLFDPIWYLIKDFNIDLFINDTELTKLLFDNRAIINFGKLIQYNRVFNKVAYDMFYIVDKHRNGKYNIFTAMRKVLSEKYKYTNHETDEILYIINDICLWGNFENVFDDTEKGLISILEFTNLYRTSGIKFMYEI